MQSQTVLHLLIVIALASCPCCEGKMQDGPIGRVRLAKAWQKRHGKKTKASGIPKRGENEVQ